VRYAVLSDIHGNLEALEAVLADASAESDAVLCLGDVVGYGADPVACVELVAARAATTVAGNHEHGVAGLLDLDWFNPYARAAAEWTRERLDRDHVSYLASLPLTAEVADATLVHASPRHPEEWDYLISAEDGLGAFAAFSTRLCFVGHSHMPGIWSLGSTGPEYLPGTVEVTFEHGRRYLANVGSVGQPRDRDPRAAYALWDVERGRLGIRRVPYEVERAQRKIVAGGLPRLLSDRLARGA
jgi:diadenosine tetraphosphatase ApaH/serine/threonine PP2A family protein phosphatase